MAVITNERLVAVASDLKRVVSQIDYNQFDYFSIKAALLQYLKLQYPNDYNDYVENSVITALIEELAYLGEQLAFRQDSTANQLLPSTSTNRDIVLDQFSLIAYESARPNSATGVASLVMQYDTDGVTPLTDADYIAGLPRWMFSPYIYDASTATLTTNGVYKTVVQNHIKVPIKLGSETLAYELTSTDYNNGYTLQPVETGTLSLVFDGNTFNCIIQQGTTITESVTQSTTEADLTLQTSKASCDQTVPYVSVNGIAWTYTPSIYINTLKEVNVYTTRHDFEDRISIIFGDGIKSSVPRGTIEYIYRVTDGIKGNAISTVMDGITVNVVAQNPSSGNRNEQITFTLGGVSSISGGADQETLDTIKRHGPYAYAAQGRQVSGPDYVTSVLDVEGVKLAKAVNRTYAGHDATGTYSAILNVSEDATSGTATSFDTATSFNGVNLGVDTITVIDPTDISNLHPISSVSNSAGTWTVNTVTGMPASWTGNYMWKHWTANSNGSVKWPILSYAAGTVTVDGFTSDVLTPINKILIHDYVNGNWYYADSTDVTYDTVAVTATIAFRDGNGTLQSGVTLTGAFVYVDYTYSADVATTLTVPTTPAPDTAGDFIYYPTGTINVGDTLWETVSGDGYVVLDVIREAQTVSTVVYDKVFIGRNARTSAPSTLAVAGATFTRTSYFRQSSVLTNPSKSNIIDLYCIQTDADGYAYTNPSNTLSLTTIQNYLDGTQMETDIVLANWGKIKKLQIPLTVYLKAGTAASTEIQKSIQNAVYEYFLIDHPIDWKYQTFTFGDTFHISPFIQYLHDTFAEIDYIDHTSLDAVDKTTVYNELLSVDRNYSGVSIG